MTESVEPRRADGSEESYSVELGEPTDLEDVQDELADARPEVPDLDARENRIPSERRAAGPPLLPATPSEALDDREDVEPASESLPTDPA